MLPVRKLDNPDFAFGPSYAIARQLVVVRRGKRRPEEPEALNGLLGGVSVGQGAAAVAERELPPDEGYRWEIFTHETEELLGRVDAGSIDYAIVPEFEFQAARPYFPELLPAFEIGQPRAIAWLYRTQVQNSLLLSFE